MAFDTFSSFGREDAKEENDNEEEEEDGRGALRRYHDALVGTNVTTPPPDEINGTAIGGCGGCGTGWCRARALRRFDDIFPA